ncbi:MULTISPECIES: DUF6262 family protein [Mycobacteriaceae]|jgi:hypothetical protein|uniref:DUF6262 family protein n=1 Tax=Mycolicibacterium nivoides TaxID=2487344 RepID=A0ABW9LKK3_9MYCO|nr:MULTISPECIES: DUF6262 family protein [Mycobacteriaceae]
MTETNTARVDRLRAAAARKSADAKARARRALVSLANRGAPINFNTVANEASVSKGYLYGDPDLRHEITERRRQPPRLLEPGPRSARSKAASAEVKLAVATDVIRQLRAENEQLRGENATLRGDLLATHQASRLRSKSTEPPDKGILGPGAEA